MRRRLAVVIAFKFPDENFFLDIHSHAMYDAGMSENAFNLEQSIAEWRRQISAAGIKTPAHLDELESYLRDEIAQQTKLGLTAAEAFLTAIQKLGPASAVHNEFKKVGDDRTSGNRQLLNRANLVRLRPWVIVGNLILGALLAGPRIINQVITAAVLQVFFETSVLITGFLEGERRKASGN
jgi:hypothetical protein